MKRFCIGCKTVLPLHWYYDKCSSCFRVTGEWSESEYWAHIADFGHTIDHYGYNTAPIAKNKIFKPPVWY